MSAVIANLSQGIILPRQHLHEMKHAFLCWFTLMVMCAWQKKSVSALESFKLWIHLCANSSNKDNQSTHPLWRKVKRNVAGNIRFMCWIPNGLYCVLSLKEIIQGKWFTCLQWYENGCCCNDADNCVYSGNHFFLFLLSVCVPQLVVRWIRQINFDAYVS